MCLIVFAWCPGQPWPLRVAANRDEFHARPTAMLHRWSGSPVIAGRDLEANGTWMGVGLNGRFAALTNIRNPRLQADKRSRGELPMKFLEGDLSPMAFLQQTTMHLDDYAGFNLLCGDRTSLCFLNSCERGPRTLASGVYGVSNASLDTPWPKVLKARQGLIDHLPSKDPEALFELLHDCRQADDQALPDTGIGLERERFLSSIFIEGEEYGTRASTILRVAQDGRSEIVERRFGPAGCYLGETAVSIDPDGEVRIDHQQGIG